MEITFDEFAKKYLGKTEGYPEGQYVGECLSLVKLYIKEVLGLPNPPASGCNGARCYWSNFPDPLGSVLVKIPNTDDFVPQKGDIMVWNGNTGGGFGHIAICTGKNTGLQYFESLDQNWNGRQAHYVNHNYNNVYGVLRSSDIIDGTPLIEANMADKPKIDLGSPWGELEIETIKSKLNDGLRDFTNLENKYKELLENPPSGGLSTEQVGALGDVLKKATAAQFELTNKKILAVQTAVDITENNLTGDREGLGTMQVDQASMLTEMREFKILLTSQTEKISNAVKVAVEKAIIDVSDKIKTAVKSALNGFTDQAPTLRKKTLWEKLSFWK